MSDDKKTERPVGHLFTRVYTQRPENQKDSERARRRFFEAFWHNSDDGIRAKFQRTVAGRLGIAYNHHERFWLNSELRDFLDGITLFAQIQDSNTSRERWLRVAEFILRDEGMAYTLDERGGLHPFVDSEFQQLQGTVLRRLDEADEKVVHNLVITALRSLDGRTRNYKHALGDIYEAVETMIKARTGESRMNSTSIAKLREQIVLGLAGNERAINYTRLITQALDDWGNAIHQYRHGQPTEEVMEPPEYIAIQGVSSGLSWIRWILDAAAKPTKD